MPELPEDAEKHLRQTHAKGCQLFRGTEFKPESVETAIEVERHRWFWKPKKVKLVLLAESHVLTSAQDMSLRVDESEIRPLLRSDATSPPDSFVRLVYCLAYGESDTLARQRVQTSNPGTPTYWDIFGRVTFRGPQPRQENGASFKQRVTWKIETLRELHRRGIWLLDASVHAIYLRHEHRLPDHMKQELHRHWWEGYGRFLLSDCGSPKVWVIGKTVYNCLAEFGFKDWNCRGWVYQPSASGYDPDRNWPGLLDDCR